MSENSGDQGWSDRPLYPRRARPPRYDAPDAWPPATHGWSEVPGAGEDPPPPPPYRSAATGAGGGSVYGRPVVPEPAADGMPSAGSPSGVPQGGLPQGGLPQQAGTRPGGWPMAPPAPRPPAWPPADARTAGGVSAPPSGGASAAPSGVASAPPAAPGWPPYAVPAAPGARPGPPPQPPPGAFPPVPAPFPPGGGAGLPPGQVAPRGQAVPPGQGAPRGFPPGAASAPGARRRWSRSSVLLAVAVVVLIVQSVLLVDMRLRLDDTRDALASGQKTTGDRLNALERRAGQLERTAGRAFDPAAVAAAVKPSVFRVEAGDYSGTAFAVGRGGGSGTDLLTNFHVVEQVYKANKRKVALVRGDLRYPATITRVSRGHDLAQLHTTAKIPRLVTAKAPVASGQPIVVIGAPLGLEGSVTSGVISAIRTDLPSTQSAVVQFDAPINPGNSGGPVVDGTKQVVGIASAKIDAARGVGPVEGIGLAIPIAVACRSFASLC